jgi:hypothetical protein
MGDRANYHGIADLMGWEAAEQIECRPNPPSYRGPESRGFSV